MRFIRCNKCGHTGAEGTFPQGRDFFQSPYVAACPQCDNRQSPGGASMRMAGGERPFVFVEQPARDGTVLGEVLANAEEAS